MSSAGNNPDRDGRSVLLVGTEDILLSTRQAILEHQSMTVSLVRPEQALDAILTVHPDIVVVCHTLKPEEANRIANAAARLPSRPVLLRFTSPGSPQTIAGYDGTIDSTAHPVTFVDAVKKVTPQTHRAPGA